MPGNPFGAELDALITDIEQLNGKIGAASGADKDALMAERSAKVQAAAKIDAMSEDWRLGRLTEAVDALKAMSLSELARQARIVDRLRSMLVAQGITPPGPAAQPVAPAASPPAAVVNAPVGPAVAVPVVQPAPHATAAAPGAGSTHRGITIDARTFDALARVAQSEVGHFAKHGLDQLVGGIGAVVETILNRVAHKDFPDTIEAVVNAPFQFSAINTLGDWSLLPDARVNIQTIVRDYLDRRIAGRNGSLGGATHFLNPHLSSSTALAQWGNHVVSNAVAVFGDDSKKDVHFHGFAPGTRLPGPHAIHFGRWSPVFDGRGEAQVGAEEKQLRLGLVKTLETEFAFFDGGKLKEDHDNVWQRVGTYWSALGLPFHGRSKVTLDNGKVVNPAWSAAFISWTIQQQGVGPERFKGAQGHWTYVRDAINASLPNPLFEAMDPADYAPQPGDLVHYGREWASQFNFSAAKAHLLIDGFYPSHSDFVTSVDAGSGELTTIGGNVTSSVGAKKLGINADGSLKPRKSGGSSLPWITVLRLRTG